MGLELVSQPGAGERATTTMDQLETLLATMRPSLDPGRYAFATLPPGCVPDPARVVASIREAEGMSVVLPEQDALAMGLPVAFTAAWITLDVQSDLAAVGFTAAFAQALAQAGISCNVVAGTRHDHLFVPAERADEAIAVLQALQRAAGG